MDDAFLEEIARVEQAALSELQSESRSPTNRDVIIIESDSDQEDKENIPLPQRHVRQRTDNIPPSQGSVGDVIEILSDSE